MEVINNNGNSNGIHKQVTNGISNGNSNGVHKQVTNGISNGNSNGTASDVASRQKVINFNAGPSKLDDSVSSSVDFCITYDVFYFKQVAYKTWSSLLWRRRSSSEVGIHSCCIFKITITLDYFIYYLNLKMQCYASIIEKNG